MIFLNAVSSAASLVIYLPGVCTQTDTKGKQRKARVQNILKYLGKNTIFNEHRVPLTFLTSPLRRVWKNCCLSNRVVALLSFLAVINLDIDRARQMGHSVAN